MTARRLTHSILSSGLTGFCLTMAAWTAWAEPIPAAPGASPPPAGSTVLVGIPVPAAFQPGETLEYQIRWGFITAGYASLIVQEDKEFRSGNSLRITMAATTTTFLDTIYKVRDRFTSWLAPDLSQALEYRQKQEEGRYKRRLGVIFDPAKNEAVREINGELKAPITVKPGTFDPLGAMYAVRKRTDLAVGVTAELPISDGKTCVIGRGPILREETLKTPAGTFRTLVMEPEMLEVKGVFEKSQGAKILIWFTKDHRHIPVRISSKVMVGWFTADLIAIKSGDPQAGSLPDAPTAATATPTTVITSTTVATSTVSLTPTGAGAAAAPAK